MERVASVEFLKQLIYYLENCKGENQGEKCEICFAIEGIVKGMNEDFENLDPLVKSNTERENTKISKSKYSVTFEEIDKKWPDNYVEIHMKIKNIDTVPLTIRFIEVHRVGTKEPWVKYNEELEPAGEKTIEPKGFFKIEFAAHKRDQFEYFIDFK